ncbi:CBS domain-containing protein [Maribacter sp. 4G9]|uniref:CBS domain-containing protein n=1 Tax=Maribacter sp. 4G9 TaxID=1889777 RepID=UPI000C14C486|nr:CBS domain-containing protein [Maribacter sp. 4G9]PIB25560.1 signal transduction protein [Maribacter sp. 4G9]
MGTYQVEKIDKDSRARFIKNLLNDIQALKIMLKDGMIESKVMHIGSEQEFCLVDQNWRPTQDAIRILKAIDDSHFTNEIARYNLEINLDPEELNDNCFSVMEKKLRLLLNKAMQTASKYDNKIILTGILPTITTQELSMEFMTPNIRYELLNNAVKLLRKKDFEMHIRGVDELSIQHDSVLFEACNTSFQMHLQIAPDDFVASYNWAQAISGPVLGIATNSSLLMGRELWSETRIALFQQSIDTRSSSYTLQDKLARVTFGNSWASGSIIDIYKEDIAQYEVMLINNVEKDSLLELKIGNIPKLNALNLHNGTIYRWNRPCYGATEKNAHIRIENRYLPSGPTILDEMANFAFWVGLMKSRPAEFDDINKVMDFRDAKDNFIKAARNGSASIMLWKGIEISTRDLVIKELLPLAYEGLKKCTIDPNDIHRYLEVIERRATGNSGARWSILNYRQLKKNMKQDDAVIALTKAIYENQQTSAPVSDWPMIPKEFKVRSNARLAKHIMSTQLLTVNENDMADMATTIMNWKNIHHVPVLDDKNELCGLLTWSHMTEYLKEQSDFTTTKVGDLMVNEVISVTPETDLETVYELLEKNHIGCLPVVSKSSLVGIITLKDMTEI